MLRFFFKQGRGKQDEEPSNLRPNNIPTPSLLGDNLTRPRSTPISPHRYPGPNLGSLRLGSISTPEVNTANATAIMTRGDRSASRGLPLPRTVVSSSFRSRSAATIEAPERQTRGLVDHDSGSPTTARHAASASIEAPTRSSAPTHSSPPLSRPHTSHQPATSKGDAHIPTSSPFSGDERTTERTAIASTQMSPKSSSNARVPSTKAQSTTTGISPHASCSPSTATSPPLPDQEGHRLHPDLRSALHESQAPTTLGSNPASATTRGCATPVVGHESTGLMASSRVGGSFQEPYTNSPSNSSAELSAAPAPAQTTFNNLSGSPHAIASAAETQPSSNEEETVDHLLRRSMAYATGTSDVAAPGPSPHQQHLSSPDPAFQFFGQDMTAGRDIGSRNFIQQGDGLKFAYLHSSETHIHHTDPRTSTVDPPPDEHETILRHIRNKLGSYIVEDAKLRKDVHGDPSLCYPGTRENLLEDILSWVATPSREGSPVAARAKCIVGAPGSGKSTIMNTLVVGLLQSVVCRSPGLVSAHYCVRRNLQTTRDSTKILPTLVLQLSQRDIGLAKHVAQLLDRLQETGFLNQASRKELFLDAVKAYNDNVFVIVDALDEASEPFLLAAELASVIGHSPSNLRVLLATRNDNGVLGGLGQDLIAKIGREIPTKESFRQVGAFIARRLKDGIRKLPGGSDAKWDDWPDEEQLQSLSNKADGLFIWATTAVDFILSRIRKRGAKDRDRLIDDVGRVGMADVNALYAFILRRYLEDYQEEEEEEEEGANENVLQQMTAVLAFILVPEDPLVLSDIISILGSERFDILHFVEVVRSILVPGTDLITGSTLPQVHKTFSDFITSDRAAEFKADLQDLHYTAANRCFSLMEARLRFNICGLRSSFVPNNDALDSSISKGLVYASTSWWYHLSHLKNAGAEHLHSSLRSIQTLLCENFLFWLEIISVVEKLWKAQGWMSELKGWLAKNWSAASAGGWM